MAGEVEHTGEIMFTAAKMYQKQHIWGLDNKSTSSAENTLTEHEKSTLITLEGRFKETIKLI